MIKKVKLLSVLISAFALASCSLFTGMEQGTGIKKISPEDLIAQGNKSVSATANATPEAKKEKPAKPQAATKAQAESKTKDKPAAKGKTDTKTKAQQTKKDKADAKKADAQAQPIPVISEMNEKINGEWAIVEVGNTHVSVEEDMPYVNFESSAGRFYASNGCNILNGNYEFIGQQEMTFSGVLTTLMTCPDPIYEKGINSVLADGVRIKLQMHQKGNETYLYMKSYSGQTLLTLRRHNMELLNGLWVVTNIEGREIDNPEVNLFFDIPELKVHGNTGCNYFNGSISIDPEVSNSISFAQMGVTMRMCENTEVEMALLVALEQTATYTMHTENTLKLNNDGGHHILTLKRAKK